MLHLTTEQSLIFTAVRTLTSVANNALFTASSLEAAGDLQVCLVYEIWIYWNSTQYWTQNYMTAEYSMYHNSSPTPQEAPQSVVDLDF